MRALHLQLRVDANLVKPFCHLCFASSLNVSPLIAFRPIKYPHLQKFNLSRSSRRTHFSTSFVASSMADSSLSRSSETETKPFSVLFVCLGNICRSPAAEGVFRNLVTKKGLDSKFTIDSAGTIGYHEVIASVFNWNLLNRISRCFFLVVDLIKTFRPWFLPQLNNLYSFLGARTVSLWF